MLPAGRDDPRVAKFDGAVPAGDEPQEAPRRTATGTQESGFSGSARSIAARPVKPCMPFVYQTRNSGSTDHPRA